MSTATEQGRIPATLEQVAARAGVSRSTVSRVVNGGDRVSPQALEAVQRAIADLSYVPNRAARSLASRQTQAIALVVPEDTTRFFGDPFFAAIVAGISARLSRSDHMLNLIIASDDPGDKASTFLASGSVDGALIVSHHTSDTYIDRISTFVPVVFGGRPARERDDDYVVDVDNRAAGRLATAHLLSRGHRRIGTVTGSLDMPAGVDRLAGFHDALAEAGVAPGAVEEGDFTVVGGAAAVQRMLDRGDLPDALFVASDLMARGAVQTLALAGVRIPDEVAVIGFDDSPIATSSDPALTTIRQPSHAQGEAMADVLLARLAGRPAERRTILPVELVERDTA